MTFRLNDLKAQRDGVKWTKAGPDVIPAWIADMDFPIAPVIRAAMERRIRTDLGYPTWDEHHSPAPLAEAFAERMQRRHAWTPSPGHVRVFTDLNQALQVILHHMTAPGEPIALHTPAYSAFVASLAEMDRPILSLPTEDMTGCRVLLLVNPQNPTGHVFTRDELTDLADLAERNDMLVISDEIHADLVYEPHRHIPFATLLPERTITLTSASKAFNLAGLRCAVAHIGHEPTRKALAAMPKMMYGESNIMGVEATVAAWRHGDDWLAETMRTLDANRRMIADELPGTIGYAVPEATYLAWLDFGRPGAAERLEREAKVLLSDGAHFGPGGANFARLNFATDPEILREMLRRIKQAC